MISITILKGIFTDVQAENEERIHNELRKASSPHLYFFMVVEKLAAYGLRPIATFPKNIFTFIVKYMSNTLATKKDMCKWSLCATSVFHFCFQFETLQQSPVAISIFKMVDIPGIMILFCYILLTPSHL